LGFFYLDLRNDEDGEKLLEEANQLFELGPKLYDLGRDELQKFDNKAKGSYVGYKGYGSEVVDEKGNLDRNEFYNVRLAFQIKAFSLNRSRCQKTISLESPKLLSHTPNFSMTMPPSSNPICSTPIPSSA
jgi:hypothetical protein